MIIEWTKPLVTITPKEPGTEILIGKDEKGQLQIAITTDQARPDVDGRTNEILIFLKAIEQIGGCQ